MLDEEKERLKRIIMSYDRISFVSTTRQDKLNFGFISLSL